ncbi:MAG: tetratricopeptide repeat protein, partial [Vampirovibrionia bacterium]
NPETWYLKANCFYKLNNYPKTTATIEKALEINPENSHYQAVKGLSLFSEKKYPEALKYLTMSLKTNPQQAKTWCLKGFAELYTLEFEKALKSFDKTLTIKNNYLDAILGKAVILKRLERYEEALGYFRKLQNAKPEDSYINKCLRECIIAINKSPT